MLNTLPDNLSSPECIRTMSLKHLEKVKQFAQKEHKAKLSYMKRQSKANRSDDVLRKGKSLKNTSKGKGPAKNQPKHKTSQDDNAGTSQDFCKGCLVTWDEDMEAGVERLWLQCDICDGWLHAECLTNTVDKDEPFSCPDCQ